MGTAASTAACAQYVSNFLPVSQEGKRGRVQEGNGNGICIKRQDKTRQDKTRQDKQTIDNLVDC